MKRIQIILISMFVWLIILTSFLILIPAHAQSGLPTLQEYPAPASKYIFEKSFTDVVSTGSLEINVPFAVPRGSPKAYNSTVLFLWYVTMLSDDVQRVVTVNYTFSSNERHFDWIREDFVGLNGSLGGSYPVTIIDPQKMRTGNNQLAMKVLITSQAEKTSNTYFYLKISDVRVIVETLDLDRDGILDAVDSLLGYNNYLAAPLFGLIGLPVAVVVTSRLPKKY